MSHEHLTATWTNRRLVPRRDRLDDKEPEPLMLGHAARACRVDLAVNRVQLSLRLCEIAPASTTMAQTKAVSLGNHIDDRE